MVYRIDSTVCSSYGPSPCHPPPPNHLLQPPNHLHWPLTQVLLLVLTQVLLLWYRCRQQQMC